MERIKNWHIFGHKIPITLALIAADMLVVVCALSNVQPRIINEERFDSSVRKNLTFWLLVNVFTCFFLFSFIFLQIQMVTIYWKKGKAEMCLPGWNWFLTFSNDYKFYPTYWLTDWLTDRQTDWQTDRQTDWLTDWQTDRLTDWLTDVLSSVL